LLKRARAIKNFGILRPIVFDELSSKKNNPDMFSQVQMAALSAPLPVDFSD
jgi:hypothetical protein